MDGDLTVRNILKDAGFLVKSTDYCIEEYEIWNCFELQSGKRIEVRCWPKLNRESDQFFFTLRRLFNLSEFPSVPQFLGLAASPIIHSGILLVPVEYQPDGISLREIINEIGALDEASVAVIIREILLAVSHLHSLDITFRELVRLRSLTLSF
jgi:serine/threonine protein kinase